MDEHRPSLRGNGTGSSGPRLRSAAVRAAVVGIPLAFIGLFFVYPVASIIGRGLTGDGFGIEAFADVVTDGDLIGIAWFTLWQAAASTLITVALALPGAYVISRYRFRGRRLLRAILTVPLILPTVVVGVAFLTLAGRDGALGVDLEGSILLILWAHAFYNYAVVLRTVGGLWANLDPRITDAARVLGAGRVRTFLEVTLPMLRPAIAAASSIVFLFSFTSFGVILILGAPRRATLEVEIFRQTTQALNLEVAAVLALAQLVGVFLILRWYSRYQERRAVPLSLRSSAEIGLPVDTPQRRRLLAANLVVMGGLLLAPLAVLTWRSLSTPDGFGFDFYRSLGEAGGRTGLSISPLGTIGNSLAFAAVAAAVALLVGGLAAIVIAYGKGAWSSWFDSLLMLPLGTSAVTVGFGFLISLDKGFLDLRTSWVIIPLAHALVAIPFVIRVTVPMMRSIDRRLREAASVLGASPLRVIREVDLPIVWRAAMVAMGFAAAISLGEFGATAFIVRPDVTTIPVAIFRLLGRPGALNFGMAMAMSVILLAVTGGVMMLIERFRVRDVGEF